MSEPACKFLRGSCPNFCLRVNSFRLHAKRFLMLRVTRHYSHLPPRLPPRLVAQSSISSSTRIFSSSSSSLSSSSSSVALNHFVQSRAFLDSQSRNSSHSTWETTSNLVETLKKLSDDELLDRLDHLERINGKLRRALNRRRPSFRSDVDVDERAYVVDEDGAQSVALLVTYLGWDLPAFASAHPGVTTTQDAILDACYKSGLAADEDDQNEEEGRRKVEELDVTKKRTAAKVRVTGIDDEADGTEWRSGGDDGRSEFFASDDGDGGDDDDDDSVPAIGRFGPPRVEEEQRSSLRFVGCGRTDVGVSGLHQVVTLRLKRAAYADDGGTNEEFSYVETLNRFLPPEMRILGWSPVPDDFSARFNCTQRSYTYLFPKGDLDLDSMREAASRLVGFHDFRNFCKMKKDVARNIARYGEDGHAVSFFFKCVQSAEIVVKPTRSGLTICELRISANGFLWHQIRCFVSVLLLVGQNLESPDIVDRLLDVEALPEKPFYGMAAGFPLALSGSEFLGLASWRYDRDSLLRLRDRFGKIAVDLSAKSAIAARCASACRREVEGALKIELLAVLNERRKQLENPVGYDVLRSIREKNHLFRSQESNRDALNDSSKPYKFLDEDDHDGVKPYFLYDDAKETSRSKRKRRGYKPLLLRARRPSLETRVQYCRDLVELTSND